MVVTGILAALQRFTSRVSEESVTEQSQSVNGGPAKNPPNPNKERIETQQDEVSKVTKEEPQIKREDDAENEVISQVFYHTQSSSAKREQVSISK